MDQTSWLDLSIESDSITSPSPPPSPRKSTNHSFSHQNPCCSHTQKEQKKKELTKTYTASSPIKLARAKSIIGRSASRASVYSISPNTSGSDDQLLGRDGLAPWDRTVDIVYHKYKRGESKPDRDIALKASIDNFFSLHKRQRPSQTSNDTVPQANI